LLEWFDSVGWGDRKDVTHRKPVPLIPSPEVLFQNMWRKRIEEGPAKPG